MHSTSDTSVLAARCRSVAVWSGPLAIASVALVIAAEIRTPGMLNALGSAGAVAGLLAAVALVLGAVGLHLQRSRGGAGDLPFLVLVVGGVLAAGGMWDQVFTLPVLSSNAPELLQQEHASVLAGFLLSYGLLGAGALAWTITLRRHELLTKAEGRWLIAGSVLCFTPLPTRFFLLAVAVSILARNVRTEPSREHLVSA